MTELEQRLKDLAEERGWDSSRVSGLKVGFPGYTVTVSECVYEEGVNMCLFSEEFGAIFGTGKDLREALEDLDARIGDYSFFRRVYL